MIKNIAPDGQIIEFLHGPNEIKIKTQTPEFGWIVHSSSKNDIQSAYQILVASDLKMLQNNQADMWNSELCNSRSSINVPYQGMKLKPYTTYYWKVKTWCEFDGESTWSEIMQFTTDKLEKKYSTSRYLLKQTAILPSKIIRKSKKHYLIDFGKVSFGYLHLQLNVTELKRKIKIHFAERGNIKGINKKPKGNVRYYKIKQTLTNGVNKIDIHPPKNIRNTTGNAIKLPNDIGSVTPFRYVELNHCPEELNKSMIQQIAIHYPFDESASTFESSDPILNEIWELCKYTMKATSFCGIYVDGERERIPYEADAYINQLTHYAVDREYSIARYSHEYLLTHPTWPTEWKQHSVLMAWTDYLYTGNSKSLVENYELLKSKTLENFARGDGLLNTKEMRDIVDWPSGERDNYEFKEVNTVVNSFYYKTLIQMAEIASAIGNKSDAVDYQEKAAKLKIVFNKILFDYKRGIYVDGENAEHASLHANMMPLAFGLVPEDRKTRVADYIVSKGMACSVYGAQYLLEALYESGRSEAALKRLTSKDIRSWYNMLKIGSTITLEAWDNKFKPNQDWNHAWGAAPGNIIPRYLMGIRPLEPGFRKILIQPQPASLKKASITIPSIRGPISVSFKNDPLHSFELLIDIPVNMSAKVGIPQYDKQISTLLVDGKEISAQYINGYLFVDEIGSGTHIFSG